MTEELRAYVKEHIQRRDGGLVFPGSKLSDPKQRWSHGEIFSAAMDYAEEQEGNVNTTHWVCFTGVKQLPGGAD